MSLTGLSLEMYIFVHLDLQIQATDLHIFEIFEILFHMNTCFSILFISSRLRFGEGWIHLYSRPQVLVSKSGPAPKLGCFPRISKTNKTLELRWNWEAIGFRTEPEKNDSKFILKNFQVKTVSRVERSQYLHSTCNDFWWNFLNFFQLLEKVTKKLPKPFTLNLL
jgi:hypothetical protein